MSKTYIDFFETLKGEFIASLKFKNKFIRLWGTTTIDDVEVLKRKFVVYPGLETDNVKKFLKLIGSSKSFDGQSFKGVTSYYFYINSTKADVLDAEDLADIKIGDIVWLDGDLMTCRDVAHRRLVEYGRELPYDVRNKAIFHAGPIVRKKEGTEDEYEMVSVGPTTSMRMEKFEYEFTQHTGVRVIVGKGGMGPNTERACKEFGAIHCVFPAGCAVVAATEVERIAEHHWDELGMPETLWCCKVKEFGPLIVSIDAQGRNLFEENKITFNEKKEEAKQDIYPNVKFIK